MKITDSEYKTDYGGLLVVLLVSIALIITFLLGAIIDPWWFVGTTALALFLRRKWRQEWQAGQKIETGET